MEWGQSIGPALSGIGGALILWISQVAMKGWNDRQKARQSRADREDLLHQSRRVLLDEIGRLRALLRHHQIPEEEIGPMVADPWDDREHEHG